MLSFYWTLLMQDTLDIIQARAKTTILPNCIPWKLAIPFVCS